MSLGFVVEVMNMEELVMALSSLSQEFHVDMYYEDFY